MNNQPAKERTAKGRFQDREKRLNRRTERDLFKRLIMPALYIFGAIGWAVFLITLLFGSLTGTDISSYTLAAIGPTILVGLLETYRFVRGHHNETLDEP